MPTDRGMCCTFNMEKADKMFEKSQYSEMITMMQESGLYFRGTELTKSLYISCVAYHHRKKIKYRDS